MANSLSHVIPQILAQGLMALRENAIMPMLVNRAYSPDAGTKGSTVDVPIPSAIAANDVVPGPTAQTATDLSPTKVQVVLDQWKEAAFTLSDKEQGEAMDGLRPMQVTEAVRVLCNAVDAYILAKYKGIYGFAGVGGTTPFGTNLSEAINARRELARNLCPASPRYVVIDEDAEAKALTLEAVHRADYTGDRQTYVQGFINRVMGADWHMDHNLPTHTAGTLLNGLSPQTKVVLATGAHAAGATTLAADHTTLTGTVVQGDVLSFAGHSGTYVVTNSTPITASGNAITGVTLDPPLRANVADNEEITFQATHVVNLIFHRDAFALATRPLEDTAPRELGSLVMSEIDTVSGLALRLEVNRQHKQTRWSFDILYGAALVRPALAARILG